MNKPARLELNNSGSWKLIARFDVAITDATDEIMNAAEALAKAINDPAYGREASSRRAGRGRRSSGGESSFIDTAIGADNLPTGITAITRHRLQG